MSKLWPPAFQIKHSRRARHASLKISPGVGLEIILPSGFNLAEMDTLLREKRPWIEKNLKWIQSTEKSDEGFLPQQIELKTCFERWQVQYLPSFTKIRVIENAQKTLTVIGDMANFQGCRQALLEWLQQKARQILLPSFYALSQELNLPYKKVEIRGQKTRWGSCSAHKAISLNYKLLFLPCEITHHTMIHELCHTVHLNHSRQFWQLVAYYDANWKKHRQLLRRIGSELPRWVEN